LEFRPAGTLGIPGIPAGIPAAAAAGTIIFNQNFKFINPAGTTWEIDQILLYFKIN